MSEMKSPYDLLIERLRKEGKVEELSAEEAARMAAKVQDDLDEYRFENAKRSAESEADLAKIILTA